MLCPVTTTTSMTKAFKKENRVPLWSVTVVWSLEFIIRHWNGRSTSEVWTSFESQPDCVILLSWQKIKDYIVVWSACLTCLRAEKLSNSTGIIEIILRRYFVWQAQLCLRRVAPPPCLSEFASRIISLLCVSFIWLAQWPSETKPSG